MCAGERGQLLWRRGARYRCHCYTAIYERMLEASLHHRERFMEIEDMMKMLPDNSSILEEFKKLYDVFCEALKT